MRFRVSLTAVTAYVVLFLAIGIMFHGLLLLDKKHQPKSDVVTLAKQYLGVPYHYGGPTPTGFDCSGYMLFVFHQFGKELPRTADQQTTIGSQVDIGNLRPSNIVFFVTTEEPPSPTLVYILVTVCLSMHLPLQKRS